MSKQTVQANKLLPFLNEKYHQAYTFEESDQILRKEMLFSSVASLDEANATVECTISTDSIDRQGDKVLPEGIDVSDYKKNSIVLLNHDYSLLPIAKCSEITVKGHAILAKIQFATETELGKEVYTLVKGGFLKGVSVGFAPVKCFTKGTRAFVDKVKELGLQTAEGLQRIIDGWKLYEFSIVSLPANQDCVIKAMQANPEHKYEAIQKYLKMEVKEEVVEPIEQGITIEVEPKDGFVEWKTVTADSFVRDTLALEEKPFKNEHAARIKDPKDFDSFRRKNDAFGSGIHVIYGIKGGKAEVQSIRFSADKFTVAEAHAWLTAHKYHPIEFAAAKKEEAVVETATVDNAPVVEPPKDTASMEPKIEPIKVIEKEQFIPIIRVVRPVINILQTPLDVQKSIDVSVAKEIERIRIQQARKSGKAIL